MSSERVLALSGRRKSYQRICCRGPREQLHTIARQPRPSQAMV